MTDEKAPRYPLVGTIGDQDEATFTKAVLFELFNRGLGRAPDDTYSLVDETTVRPRTVKIADAAQRMAEHLAQLGLEIRRKR